MRQAVPGKNSPRSPELIEYICYQGLIQLIIIHHAAWDRDSIYLVIFASETATVAKIQYFSERNTRFTVFILPSFHFIFTKETPFSHFFSAIRPFISPWSGSVHRDIFKNLGRKP
jgi:hypothetical protein